MKADIIRIGNSRGVRLPKLIIEQCGFSEEVDLELQNDGLLIKASSGPRSNWNEAFAKMREQDEDALLDSMETATAWEEDEWEW
jgi:antitoxin MazE